MHEALIKQGYARELVISANLFMISYCCSYVESTKLVEIDESNRYYGAYR